MSEDKELEILTARKMLELRRKLAAPKQEAKSPRDLVVERLVDRGVEVLEAAEHFYPKETDIIVKQIAELIKRGLVSGYISGGELLWLFKRVGLPIHVETKITVEDRGKFVSLAEKLSKKEE